MSISFVFKLEKVRSGAVSANENGVKVDSYFQNICGIETDFFQIN